MLDKSGGIPLYIQLKQILREQIVTGIYREGQVIPSETQLVNEYGITRTTARKAIEDLVNEGLLYKVHGKGTFVCLKLMKYNIWNFGGFTDYLRKRNEIPVSQVLQQEIITCGQKPRLKLVRARGVKKGESVVYLTIDTSILPLEVFPGIEAYDFARESVYDIMRQKYGVYPRRAELGVHSIQCDKVTKRIFKLPVNASLLMAEGQVFDEEGAAIEDVKVIYGPNVEFKIVANMVD